MNKTCRLMSQMSITGMLDAVERLMQDLRQDFSRVEQAVHKAFLAYLKQGNVIVLALLHK